MTDPAPQIDRPDHRSDRADAPERELERVVLRLAALGPDRLQRPGPDARRPSEAVRVVLMWLADAAADAERRPRRAVPELAPHALGDQLVVLTRDLLRAEPTPQARAEVAQRLVALRRAL